MSLQDSDSDRPTKNPDHFIEDPAVLRQKAEDRARWKANRNQGNRGQGHQGQGHQGQASQGGQGQSQSGGQSHGQSQGGGQKYDVKGGPKGQGQSAEVQRNRKWKSQHKGDNRRAMADKKRRV